MVIHFDHPNKFSITLCSLTNCGNKLLKQIKQTNSSLYIQAKKMFEYGMNMQHAIWLIKIVSQYTFESLSGIITFNFTCDSKAFTQVTSISS